MDLNSGVGSPALSLELDALSNSFCHYRFGQRPELHPQNSQIQFCYQFGAGNNGCVTSCSNLEPTAIDAARQLPLKVSMEGQHINYSITLYLL